MNKTGFHATDWIFFFSKKNKKDLNSLLVEGEDKDNVGEFTTYKLITVYLPVVPYAIVLLLNIFLNINSMESWFSFLNNGSLPIISFGIISAGMPYLLEQLEEYPNFHIIRRRVMAVSLIFLFLTASMYIFQTISGIKANTLTSLFSLILSVYIFFFCASVGYKMYILQSKNIKTYAGEMRDEVEDLKDDLKGL